MASIIVTNDNNEVDEYEFGPDQNVISIGRRSSNEVCLTDLSVSGRHARLTRDEGGTWVEDLNSTNGTYINGRLISRQRLHNGDELMLGKIRLTWLIDAEASEPTTAAPRTSAPRTSTSLPASGMVAEAVSESATASVGATTPASVAESTAISATALLDDDDYDPEEEAAVAAAVAASADIPEFAAVARRPAPARAAVSEPADATANSTLENLAADLLGIAPTAEGADSAPAALDDDDDDAAILAEFGIDKADPELSRRSAPVSQAVDDPLDASDEEEREFLEAARLFNTPSDAAPELSANMTLQPPEFSIDDDVDHDHDRTDDDGQQLSLTARARLALGRVPSVTAGQREHPDAGATHDHVGVDADHADDSSAPTSDMSVAARARAALEPEAPGTATRHAEAASGNASTAPAAASSVTTLHRPSADQDTIQPTHELDKPRTPSSGAVIEIKNGAKSGQILPIDKPVTTLGRPGIQIAAIMRKPDGYFLMHIESDDSVNRPTLNRDAIGDEPVLLHSGDELNVAGIDVEFMLS